MLSKLCHPRSLESVEETEHICQPPSTKVRNWSYWQKDARQCIGAVRVLCHVEIHKEREVCTKDLFLLGTVHDLHDLHRCWWSICGSIILVSYHQNLCISLRQNCDTHLDLRKRALPQIERVYACVGSFVVKVLCS